MNKEKLNTLLDSIYELEGLVHLAITRDDEPAMLPELIRRKSRELLAHAEKVTYAEVEPSAEEKYVEVVEQDQSETLTPQHTEETDMQYTYADASQEQSASVEEYDVASEDEAPTMETEEPEVSEEAAAVNVVEEERIMPEARVLSVFQSAPEVNHDSEPEAATEAAPETEVKTESKPKSAGEKEAYKFQPYTEPRGRLVFSINDRYRFKRELFHGSDTDFNTTLSLVASMEGYDEAEDYFLNDLQWDEKSPDVIDFLEILKNYFK